LEQKVWAFLGYIVPLFVSIFCAEPQHKRIFTAIGAKERDFAFLSSSKKKEKNLINELK
jgi:hypothetical protein